MLILRVKFEFKTESVCLPVQILWPKSLFCMRTRPNFLKSGHLLFVCLGGSVKTAWFIPGLIPVSFGWFRCAYGRKAQCARERTLVESKNDFV